MPASGKTPREIAMEEIAARVAKEHAGAAAESYDVMDDETGEITPAPKQTAEVTIVDGEQTEPAPEVEADAPETGAEGEPVEGAPPETQDKAASTAFDPNKEYTLIVHGAEGQTRAQQDFAHHQAWSHAWGQTKSGA